MSQKISVGIDIGTATIKVVVVQSASEDPRNKPEIIGVGYAESDGVRHGYITNPEDTAKALRFAIHQAQKTSGYKIDKAYFAIGCEGIQGTISSAAISLGQKETLISQNDIELAVEQSQLNIPAQEIKNREILHTIPLSYKVDGKQVSGKAYGMSGETLEVRTLFVTVASQHLASLTETARLAKIQIEDVITSPLASSVTLLSKSQLIAGCGLVTIGAETVSLAVFENGVPISIDVSPIGSRQITHDIALGFKVSLEEAERIKVSRIESLPYPRRKIEEIVKARLEDTCDFIQSTLKRINKQGLLPAGIILTGGGAQSNYIEALAREKLKLPSKRIGIKFDGESKHPIHDATWSVAYGLATIGIEGTDNDKNPSFGGIVGKSAKGIKKWLSELMRVIKKMLP